MSIKQHIRRQLSSLTDPTRFVLAPTSYVQPALVYMYSDNIVSGEERVVRDSADPYYTGYQIAPGTTLRVNSTEGADWANVGSGAWSIRIYGLDYNGAPYYKDVELQALTTISFQSPFSRINGAYVLTARPDNSEDIISGSNKGTISVTDNAGATHVQIPPGYGWATSGVYSVPYGYAAVLTSVEASVGKDNCSVEGELRIRMRDSDAWSTAFKTVIYRGEQAFLGGGNATVINVNGSIEAPEIAVLAKVVESGYSGVSVSVLMNMLLVRIEAFE